MIKEIDTSRKFIGGYSIVCRTKVAKFIVPSIHCFGRMDCIGICIKESLVTDLCDFQPVVSGSMLVVSLRSPAHFLLPGRRPELAALL